MTMNDGANAAVLGAPNGAVTGGVRALLRLEGACVFAAAAAAYGHVAPGWGWGWGVFALWFLAPDLSFLGYLAGPRVGAAAYNTAHAYVGAVACVAAGVVWPGAAPVWVPAAGLIWAAHVGMDRALGFGLKYASGFGATHLGPIGRERAS